MATFRQFWSFPDFLQFLCLLHHPVHRGVLCLFDSDHLHHQSGEEHDGYNDQGTAGKCGKNFDLESPLRCRARSRSATTSQSTQVRAFVCLGTTHTSCEEKSCATFVKQSSDLTFSLQRLVDGTLSMVQRDSGSGQRRREGGRICFHSSWDQEHRRLPALDYICWRVCRIS